MALEPAPECLLLCQRLLSHRFPSYPSLPRSLEPEGYENWPRNRSFPDGKAAAAELFHRLRQLTEHLDNGNLSKACDVHDRAGVHEHGTYAQWGPLIRLLLQIRADPSICINQGALAFILDMRGV